MYSIRAPSMTQKLQYFEIFSVSFRHFMLYSLCEKTDLRTSHCFSPSPSIWGIIQRENKLFGSSIFKDDLWHGEPKRPGSLILSVRLSKQRFVERALYAHTQKVLWRAPRRRIIMILRPSPFPLNISLPPWRQSKWLSDAAEVSVAFPEGKYVLSPPPCFSPPGRGITAQRFRTFTSTLIKVILAI